MSTRAHEAQWRVELFDEERQAWRLVSYERSERAAKKALRAGGVRRYIPNPNQDEESKVFNK